MPQTPPTWQPLTHPLPPLVPCRCHTPTPITAQPLSPHKIQEVAAALFKKMTHKVYVAAVADHYMLSSSCQELERHLFDVFGAFSRNLCHVVYSACSVHVRGVCVCLLVSAMCGDVVDGDLLHPWNVMVPTKSPPALPYPISCR